MIHKSSQPPGAEAQGWQSQTLRPTDAGQEKAVPQRYVFVPDPLIAAFIRDPLAVGVYVAIARLAFAAKGAVSVAARELCAWMGSDRDADRAAVMRRIVKLEERGWLVVTRTTATKHALLPTWGRDQDGCTRPWRFDCADGARPSHLRGRRVPLALLDDYIGRLDPQCGHSQALICRYFTRPLLDLVDIGTYTIGLRTEVAPTRRLQHLGLCRETLMQTPTSLRVLLQQAQVNQLTTVVDEAYSSVALSLQGIARLNRDLSSQAQKKLLYSEQMGGSLGGSVDRSIDGSSTGQQESCPSLDVDGQNMFADTGAPLIAWNVWMVNQEINHGSSDPNQLALDGGNIGQDQKRIERQQQPSNWPGQLQSVQSHAGMVQLGQSLATSVVEGHRMLNINRTILLGEWYELLELQQAHGAEQLLIWQARANRATTPRPHGIGPAYYRACAAQAALACVKPSHQLGRPTPATPRSVLAAPLLDPECDALLCRMGVRERRHLADVSLEVITAWQHALAHPGFAARFASPIGFAVSEMRKGLLPPAIDECDGWAERTLYRTDPYQSKRHLPAVLDSANALLTERALEARVRELAPPNADVEMLCEIAQLVETGATATAIQAYLHPTLR